MLLDVLFVPSGGSSHCSTGPVPMDETIGHRCLRAALGVVVNHRSAGTGPGGAFRWNENRIIRLGATRAVLRSPAHGCLPLQVDPAI